MAEAADSRLPPAARRSIQVRNPATLEPLREVPVTTFEELARAERRARAAQRQWCGRSFRERAEALYRYREALLDQGERIADVLTAETGKPRSDAWAVELLYVCDAISYWAKNAERFLADQRIRPHLLRTKVAYSTYVPMGVIGIIGPWNFPLVLTIGEALPALAAGNAVLIKPSEIAPLSAMLGAEIWRDAGLPPDLLQVLPGYGDLGSKLIDHVDMICFTGSVATGRKVAVKAAEQLKPCTLELGGKDPMIVLRDANLERAANACVWGGLLNAGQVCLSIERVYVEEAVYDRFVELLEQKIRQVRQGLPHESVDVGSMTFEGQLQKVQRHVDDALSKGARCRVGGRRRPDLPGLFYEPTLLVDVHHDMELMREETFGPVIAVQKVKDEEEAIRLANDSSYGLGASLFTGDRQKGRVLARRIESGAVCINDCLVNFAFTDVPMGGIKESGLGRRHGVEGIRKFCHQRTVVVDRLGLRKEFHWFPASPWKLRALRRAMKFLFRPGGRRRLFG